MFWSYREVYNAKVKFIVNGLLRSDQEFSIAIYPIRFIFTKGLFSERYPTLEGYR